MEQNDAELMAEYIEQWLGNPISRRLLKFLTKRCPKDGRRAENALKAYAVGKSKKLCIRCKVSNIFVKRILDSVLARAKMKKENSQKQLKDHVWRKGFASVLEGIAEYGTQKPFTSYAPFLVVWNITKACNLHCRHCYESAGRCAPKELSTKEALDAVDKMADAGVAYIAISGGEPLMRKDLFRIASRIREKEMGFSVATNGTLLTKENARELKECGCISVQVSLDGAVPKTHNWFRGADAFERTIEGIKNATSEGIIVNISTTVTRHNLCEVPDIISLAEKLGAGFMHYNFIPTGKGKDIAGLDLSPVEREALLKSMAEETRKRKITLLSTAPQYGRVCAENEAAMLAMSHFDPSDLRVIGNSLRFLADFVGGCGTGRLYCALEPNGDITPCVFIPIKIGNIRNNGLLDIWHNSKVLKKIRSRAEFRGNCGICKYRNMCGGCRARAYAYFGDIQGFDPGCVHNEKYNLWPKQNLIKQERKSVESHETRLEKEMIENVRQKNKCSKRNNSKERRRGESRVYRKIG